MASKGDPFFGSNDAPLADQIPLAGIDTQLRHAATVGEMFVISLHPLLFFSENVHVDSVE